MNRRDLNDVSDVSCLFIRVLIGSSPSAPQCLTCGLRKDRCQYNSAYFSFDASYYRLDCYGKLNTTLPLRKSLIHSRCVGVICGRGHLWTIIWAQISKVIQKTWCSIKCFRIFYFCFTRTWVAPLHTRGQQGLKWRSVYLLTPSPFVQIFIAVVLFYSQFILSS